MANQLWASAATRRSYSGECNQVRQWFWLLDLEDPLIQSSGRDYLYRALSQRLDFCREVAVVSKEHLPQVCNSRRRFLLGGRIKHMQSILNHKSFYKSSTYESFLFRTVQALMLHTSSLQAQVSRCVLGDWQACKHLPHQLAIDAP